MIKLGEDQKKRSSPKLEHFFPEPFFFPNSSGQVRSDAHQRQIIEGDADVHHIQTFGGDTIKLLGWIYSPSPRVLAPLLQTM